MDPQRDNLDPSVNTIAEPGGPGYRLRTAWKPLSQIQLDRLRAMVLDTGSWQTEAKACLFNPNIAYRWIAGADTTSVLLCHSCDTMEGWNGASRLHGEVDPAAKRLLAMTVELFPGDSLITAIVAGKERK